MESKDMDIDVENIKNTEENIIVLDFETTGLNPSKDKIIEMYLYKINDNTFFHKFINPECKINPATTKVHGLTDDDLKKSPIFKDISQDLLEFCGDECYIIAHNGDSFDKLFLKCEFININMELPKSYKWIDTLKLSRYIYPEAESHKLEILREKFNISKNGSHKANIDVLHLYEIYKNIIKELDNQKIDYVYNISKNHILEKMPFGKHKNKKFTEIPDDYIEWMISEGMLKDARNKDIKKALIHVGKIGKSKKNIQK